MIEKFFNKLLGKRPTKVLFESMGNFSLLREKDMKTIKIIDLLNKIANGEEVPKHIHIRDLDNYTWHKDFKAYWSDKDENNLLFDLDLSENDLKEDVEILEEEKKMPEKMPDKYDEDNRIDGLYWSEVERKLLHKINEILDYLETKGE